MGSKVLHLIGSFNQGGSERQAIQLARLQRESGYHHVHLACLNRSGVLLGEAEQLSPGVIPAFPLTSFYNRRAVVQLRRFARLLREREIDIVHTHDFYTNVFGMAGASLARVAVRVASRRETFGFRTAMQKRVERGAYRLAHSILANAEAVKQELINEGVRAEKIAVVYNGIEPDRVSPQPGLRRQELLALLNLPRGEGRRFVTLVANMRHPVKDHPMFLRAARRVRMAVPEAAFILAGEGELTESVRALSAELGLSDAAFFMGRCDRVAELLAVSDVCVLSSRAEGFSNSILEYMAAARPVVATDVGGAREAVLDGETGYLVAAGDDAAMAARIISLLLDPARARAMGERGRHLVCEKFSCRAQLERTKNLYERLLADSRAPWPGGIKNVRREGA